MLSTILKKIMHNSYKNVRKSFQTKHHIPNFYCRDKAVQSMIMYFPLGKNSKGKNCQGAKLPRDKIPRNKNSKGENSKKILKGQISLWTKSQVTKLRDKIPKGYSLK